MPAKLDNQQALLIDRVCIPSSPWLTLDHAAQKLGISRRKLLRILKQLQKAGKGITCGSGRLRLVHRDRLDSSVARAIKPAVQSRPATIAPKVREVDHERLQETIV